jgi:hypothetical protein
VAAAVGLLEVGDSEADVMPESIQVLVAEQFLDVPEADATANELRRA